MRGQGLFQVAQGFRGAAAFLFLFQFVLDVVEGEAAVQEPLHEAPEVLFALLAVPGLPLLRARGEVFRALHDEVDGALDFRHSPFPASSGSASGGSEA